MVLMTLDLILRVLHVTCAATMFGVTMGIGSSFKRTVGKREAYIEACTSVNRRQLLANIFGVLTLVTGLALIFEGGGMASVGKNIHISMTLLVVALAFGGLFMKPRGGKMLKLAEGGGDGTSDEEKGLGRQLAIGGGILHLIWLVILTLMFWPSL
jgi:hypothetical protein